MKVKVKGKEKLPQVGGLRAVRHASGQSSIDVQFVPEDLIKINVD